MTTHEIEPLQPNAKGYIEYNGKVYHKATLMRILAGKKAGRKTLFIAEKAGAIIKFSSITAAANHFECTTAEIKRLIAFPYKSFAGYKFKAV